MLALGALLALIASVLVWAAPIQAQGSNQPPTAIALTPSLSADGNTMTLDGTLSFDPDDGDTSVAGSCVGCTYKWEVVTSTWKFLEGFGTGLNVTTPVASGAGVVNATIDTTNVDFPSLVPSNGAIIEFRLTVTDSKGASDSDTTTYNIMTNDTPTADISLSAMLAEPGAPARDGDGDGTVTAAEHAAYVAAFTVDGVIDGPGENGNADNEWDIMEGALLTLDGSGSSDPDDDDLNYWWTLLYEAGNNGSVGFPAQDLGVASGSTLTPGGGASAATGAKLSTNGSTAGSADAQVTVGRLNVARAATAVSQSPYQVVYTLAVTDNAAELTSNTDTNIDDTALIRIVIHDQPADPKITTVLFGDPTVPDDDPQDPQIDIDGITRAFPPGDKYFVDENDSDRDIRLTASTFDADADTNGNGMFDAGEPHPTATWSEADADGSDTNGHQFRIPASAEPGDTFTITASIPRTDVSKTLTFEVIEAQQRPVATILSGNAAVPGQNNVFALTDTADDSGMFTITGFGFDPDGGSTNSVWTQIINRAPADPSDDGYVPLTGAFSNSVSFSTPDDEDIATMTLAFTVFDDESTFDSKTLIVTFDHSMDPTDPSANAGPDQVVAPGSTVTLAGSAPGVTFSDNNVAGNYSWTITGLSSSPDPGALRSTQSAAVHKSLSAFFLDRDADGIFDLPSTPADASNDDRLIQAADTGTDSGGNSISLWPLTAVAIPGATGSANGLGQFQYFTAPKLAAGLDYVQITFTLAVDDAGDAANSADHEDTVTITVSDKYFSSYIDNPGYCEDKSLGGPQTYPHDSNGDGVADVCSLASTRREAVARQNALQQLADLGLTVDVTDSSSRTSGATLTDLVLGRAGTDADTTTTPATPAVAAVTGTCSQAMGLTDPPSDADACDDGVTELTPPPSAIDPAAAGLYYSGVISGPEFCTNHSLGGARQYAHDLDDDGVADICSLHTTRREAIAVQLALVEFEKHSQFATAFAAACTALGSETFGESAAALAADACAVGLMPQRPGSGNALPN